MKRIITCFTLSIAVLSLLISCGDIWATCPPPSEYEYDPLKAGVEVLFSGGVALDTSSDSFYPSISKYNDLFYIYDQKTVRVFDEKLKLQNRIAIDPVVDLSVDMSLYRYRNFDRNYKILVHDEKIVVSIFFFTIEKRVDIPETTRRYLQMDLDGGNKRLITFDNIKSTIIDYNRVTDRIMIYMGSKIVEYTYDSTTDSYIYTIDNISTSFSTVHINKFYGDTVWEIPLNYDEYSTTHLHKHTYEYSNGEIKIIRPELKNITVEYLKIGEVVDLAIDEDYLWLISMRYGVFKHEFYYNLMKVRPL